MGAFVRLYKDVTFEFCGRADIAIDPENEKKLKCLKQCLTATRQTSHN